jgi:hypothetical protein
MLTVSPRHRVTLKKRYGLLITQQSTSLPNFHLYLDKTARLTQPNRGPQGSWPISAYSRQSWTFEQYFRTLGKEWSSTAQACIGRLVSFEKEKARREYARDILDSVSPQELRRKHQCLLRKQRLEIIKHLKRQITSCLVFIHRMCERKHFCIPISI